MKKNLLIYLPLFFLTINTVLFPQGKLLTVEDIYTNEDFNPTTLDGVQWYNNGEKYSFMRYNPLDFTYNIYEYDIESGNVREIVSEKKLISDNNQFNFSNYSWSPNHRYILFTGVMHARSLKTGGTFLIYNVENEKVIRVVDSKDEQVNIKFSPDSKKVGFVRGNNIYLIDIETGKEKQLTFDGSENILNGKFDWVYEEEFSIIDGWEWSPDSKTIAFWRLDQTDVPKVQITLYDSLYFNSLDVHYPKAGGKNSIVSIGSVNADNGKIVWMDLGKEKDIYIPRIKFTADPNILSVQKLNRLQNQLELIFFDTNTGTGNTIINESRDTWVDVNDDLTFLKNGKQLIWSSDRDGYNHLYLYNIDGTLVNQITKDKFDVKQLEAAVENNIYYTSSERGRIYTDLYSINSDGKNSKLVTTQRGTHKVNIAPTGKYFIDEYSCSGVLPKTFLFEINGKEVRELTDTIKNPLQDYQISPVKYFSFTTSDKVELDAFMIKPVDFDSTKRYPVLVEQYSGPGSKLVADSWGRKNYLWEEMLAQKGFIIVGIDNRNMGRNGSGYKKLTYKNLGKWELKDLIETAIYLDSLPYINPKKIGVWGWSYGGYMSALAVLQGADYFNTAIAVAPVTNWKFYDDIYTERYMSMPKENPEGYEESSPLNYTDKLKGNLLIIHGLADDNVHFQNSAELVNRLITAKKQFQVMFYPGKEHSLLGTKTRINLFNLMTDFLVKNLKD